VKLSQEAFVRTFLSKITNLTPVAAGAAAGLIAIGVVGIVAGNHAQSVVRSQLAPQKIFFPKPAEYAVLKPYAGQQVLTGTQAELYANDQIQPDMNKISGGKTYAQVSEEWIAGGMKSATLASERQTLFMGTTLRGMLLNAWGWAQVGTYAILGGILAIIIGSILFILPVANWLVNLRPEEARRKSTVKVGGTAHVGV
jgi:hypothetical protein